MQLTEPFTVTELVVNALEALNIPYLIGGSMASSLHGIPRSTQDVDLVIDLNPALINPLVQALQDTFYIDEEMIKDAVTHKASFNIIHLETMFKADIFILKNDPFSALEMKRKELYQIEAHREFYIASAEDTILRKLEWYRLGNEISERQWNDVIGILEIRRPDIDIDYMKKAAPQLNVSDLLNKAIQAAFH